MSEKLDLLHELASSELTELREMIRRRHGDIDGLLKILRAIVETCPWQYDAGGHPAFWHNMRVAQDLVNKIDKEARQ